MIADSEVPFAASLYIQPTSMLYVDWKYSGKLTEQQHYQAS